MLEQPALLITDDDRDLRETLGEVFAPRGFRPILAEDGERALEIVNRERIHLALFDVHMPKLTGLQTVRRLRELDDSTPCILMSARLDDVIESEAKEMDVFSVHPKPFTFSEITDVVSRAMKMIYDWPQG